MSLPDIVPIEQSCREGRGAAYHSLAAPFAAAPVPPAFIFGDLPAYLAPKLFGEYDIGGVGCFRLADAEVIFDGIILQRGAAQTSLALNHPPNHVQSVLTNQAAGWAGLPVRRIDGRAAIIHGPGFDIFGHWLIDFLPRLYALHLAGADLDSLKFILPAGLPDFARNLLRLAGIGQANLVWHDQRAERIAPDELLVPSLLRLRSRFHPLMVPATAFWADRVACHAPPPAGARIFVSRAHHGGGRVLRGRAAIEACAAEAGYDIVQPERLSLQQQISLFRSAACMIGEYGSGLHGSMFAAPGSIVCALRGASHHPGFAQSGLAERFGHRIGYVFGKTPEHAGDQEFAVEPSAFAQALSAVEAWRPAFAQQANA